MHRVPRTSLCVALATLITLFKFISFQMKDNLFTYCVGFCHTHLDNVWLRICSLILLGSKLHADKDKHLLFIALSLAIGIVSGMWQALTKYF